MKNRDDNITYFKGFFLCGYRYSYLNRAGYLGSATCNDDDNDNNDGDLYNFLSLAHFLKASLD